MEVSAENTKKFVNGMFVLSDLAVTAFRTQLYTLASCSTIDLKIVIFVVIIRTTLKKITLLLTSEFVRMKIR